ncbi:MAG: hypothetical protein E6G68_01080 [Actinobacteria bacterium]|nr:MAG: hypothetical protein E6G68_01080 [Actinomycetota bacterium]
MSERRSVWNGVALVATLGVAAAVAVVAVTRSDRKQAAPAPSPSVSPSPSPSRSPGALDGIGPYVVYASGSDVFAFDVASGKSTPVGSLDGRPVSYRSQQPGRGAIVAFPTSEGHVWTVTRDGLKRIGDAPAAAGDFFQGAALSPDDHRLATAGQQPPYSVVVVDLRSGHATAIARKGPTGYPAGSSLPIAWGLGGTVLYHVPICECDGVDPGLFALDVGAGTSAPVQEMRSTLLLGRSVVAQSGQALFYGTRTPRACGPREQGTPCEGPPFSFRRLAAGRRAAQVLARSSEASFDPVAISDDGRTLLVVRIDARTKAIRIERYADDGRKLSTPRGVPKAALPVALLPGDAIVALTQASPLKLSVVREGHARTATTLRSDDPFELAYLGWLA